MHRLCERLRVADYALLLDVVEEAQQGLVVGQKEGQGVRVEDADGHSVGADTPLRNRVFAATEQTNADWNTNISGTTRAAVDTQKLLEPRHSWHNNI